jgi:hypothetical protein
MNKLIVKPEWITSAKLTFHKVMTIRHYRHLDTPWFQALFDVPYEFTRLLTAWLRIKGYRWKRTQIANTAKDDFKLCLESLSSWINKTFKVELTPAQRFELTQYPVFNVREVKAAVLRNYPINSYLENYLVFKDIMTIWTKTSRFGKPQRYVLPVHLVRSFVAWAAGAMRPQRKQKRGAIGFDTIKALRQLSRVASKS